MNTSAESIGGAHDAGIRAPFEIRRGAVADAVIQDALRLIHLDLLTRGADPQELGEWLWGTHWFPHLRHHSEIVALARSLPAQWQKGTLCDPQILLQFPHVGPEPELTFHVDQEPGWAGDRRYLRIVGVALSSWCQENGGLIIEHEGARLPIELDSGDAVAMTPDLLHSGGLNCTGTIRYGAYFRWLRG